MELTRSETLGLGVTVVLLMCGVLRLVSLDDVAGVRRGLVTTAAQLSVTSPEWLGLCFREVRLVGSTVVLGVGLLIALFFEELLNQTGVNVCFVVVWGVCVDFLVVVGAVLRVVVVVVVVVVVGDVTVVVVVCCDEVVGDVVVVSVGLVRGVTVGGSTVRVVLLLVAAVVVRSVLLEGDSEVRNVVSLIAAVPPLPDPLSGLGPWGSPT